MTLFLVSSVHGYPPITVVVEASSEGAALVAANAAHPSLVFGTPEVVVPIVADRTQGGDQ